MCIYIIYIYRYRCLFVCFFTLQSKFCPPGSETLGLTSPMRQLMRLCNSSLTQARDFPNLAEYQDHSKNFINEVLTQKSRCQQTVSMVPCHVCMWSSSAYSHILPHQGTTLLGSNIYLVKRSQSQLRDSHWPGK